MPKIIKTLLITLVFLPIIVHGQEEKKENPKFNFNKSNNYSQLEKKQITKQYYNTPTIFDFVKSINKYNDSIPSYILPHKTNNSLSPFNKGLINVISELIQESSNDSLSFF